LFGGGVEPAQADPVTVVRATEIRGHLRFWWRATRGGRYTTVQDMKKAEDAIWGAASQKDRGGPSQVHIAIRVQERGRQEHPFEVVNERGRKRAKWRSESRVPEYAAFPLQPTEDEVKQGKVGMETQAVRVGVSFILTISYPSSIPLGERAAVSGKDEVEAALWAWETFGGIGARTRRGFGAVQLVKVDGHVPDYIKFKGVRQWLQTKLKQHVAGGSWCDNVPHLLSEINSTWMSIHDHGSKPEETWSRLIRALKNFRQHRRNNENQPSSYGHSDWPEPNAIRAKSNPSRMRRGPHAGRRIDAAPRAAFGLPVNFHLPHDPGLDAVLQLDEKNDRFASPLILKPLAWGDSAVGLACILQGNELPDKLYLKGDFSDNTISHQLTSSETQQIPPLNGNPDILQAFLAYLNK
jgi:CRISPR-associated protein Cmr1